MRENRNNPKSIITLATIKGEEVQLIPQFEYTALNCSMCNATFDDDVISYLKHIREAHNVDFQDYFEGEESIPQLQYFFNNQEAFFDELQEYSFHENVISDGFIRLSDAVDIIKKYLN